LFERAQPADAFERALPAQPSADAIRVGGCGKIRLGTETGQGLAADYPNGVWLVELGPIADPAPVTMSSQPRSGSLVLNNCELVLAACARLLDSLLCSRAPAIHGCRHTRRFGPVQRSALDRSPERSANADVNAKLSASTGDASPAPIRFFSDRNPEQNTLAQIKTVGSHPWIAKALPVRGFISRSRPVSEKSRWLHSTPLPDGRCGGTQPGCGPPNVRGRSWYRSTAARLLGTGDQRRRSAHQGPTLSGANSKSFGPGRRRGGQWASVADGRRLCQPHRLQEDDPSSSSMPEPSVPARLTRSRSSCEQGRPAAR
jgi:hypothetical protein